MSEGFAKIYTSMLRSSVWVGQTKEQKILWVTMLALADMNGYVASSIPGLARDAELTIEETLEALEGLKAPDKWSRSKEHEGRRLVEMDGGWRIINHKKYREMRSRKQVAHAEAQRRYESRQRGETTDQPQLMEHTDGVTGRKPRVRKVSRVRPDAADAQKQKQKQKDLPEQVGSDSTPGESLTSEESSGGVPKDLPGSARARAPDPDPPPTEPPVVQRVMPHVATTRVPDDWQHKPYHLSNARLYGLAEADGAWNFDNIVGLFRSTTFRSPHWDWDQRFDRWLLDEKIKRETAQHQGQEHSRAMWAPQRRGGTLGGLQLQPNAGKTGFEGVVMHELGDDDDKGGATA